MCRPTQSVTALPDHDCLTMTPPNLSTIFRSVVSHTRHSIITPFIKIRYGSSSGHRITDMGGEASNHKAQIVLAPSRPEITGKKSVFLAGTTSGNDWRESVTRSLSHFPVTIYNPLRTDWDSSWREDPSFKPFREQVDWELDMQDRADVIVIYYGAGTDAPISLLELGLCARSGKAIVACHPEYRKRGNVFVVAERFGLTFLDGSDGLAEAVVKRIKGLLEENEVR